MHSLFSCLRQQNLNKLQLIQNVSARLITRSNKREHISSCFLNHFIGSILEQILMITFKAFIHNWPPTSLNATWDHLVGHFWPLLGQTLKLKVTGPFLFGPLSCGITCQKRSGKLTHCLLLGHFSSLYTCSLLTLLFVLLTLLLVLSSVAVFDHISLTVCLLSF